VRKELAIERFLKQTPNRFEVATENVRCMGVRLEVDESSRRVTRIDPFNHPMKAPAATEPRSTAAGGARR